MMRERERERERERSKVGLRKLIKVSMALIALAESKVNQKIDFQPYHKQDLLYISTWEQSVQKGEK